MTVYSLESSIVNDLRQIELHLMSEPRHIFEKLHSVYPQPPELAPDEIKDEKNYPLKFRFNFRMV